MTLPLYTFGTTAEQFAQLASGDLVRFGTILKDASTGRIVAHIQETGIWRDAISSGTNLLTEAASTSNPVLSVFNTIQNEQIKSRLRSIEGMLGGMQHLQLATLATSVVGIGVTMASTAMILNRLNDLGATMDKIADKIDLLPKIWEESRVRENLGEMQTSLDRLEESPLRSDNEHVVRNVEENLQQGFTQFSNTAMKLSVEAEIDADLLRVLLSAMSVSAGAQYKALLYLDEKEAALHRAKKQCETVETLTWKLPPDVLERKTGREPALIDAMAGDISELRTRLACRPHALETMISQGIHGRELIEQATEETDEALLVLPAREQ